MQSLAIGSDGRVYALTSQGQVTIFDANGQQIATKSNLGQHPIAVAVDATGRIFVTNSEFDTQNVAILDPDGTTRTVSFYGAQEFRAVFGIAVGPDGRVYVASPGSSGIVTILDPDNLPSDISAAESYHSDNGGAYGIAVADDSRIYLTNYYADTITALAPWFVWP